MGSFIDKSRFSKSIIDVMEHIRKNLSSKITLSGLSELVHLDSSYLSGLFKKQTGSTITQYTNACRIVCAVELLLESDMTIEEIAQKSGFYDIHHFSRNFKKAQGVSPSAYRSMKKY